MISFACWLIRRRLGAYRDGELGPAAQSRTRSHLGRCRACASELAALERLRVALAAPVPEPSEAAWQAFWPKVRVQLAVPVPAVEPRWRRAWAGVLRHPRWAMGSALAAATAAIALALLAPPSGPPRAPESPRFAAPSVAPSAPLAVTPVRHAVVRTVQTTDPGSSVMIYTNPESEMTVVWVFGLEPTGR